jgi:hypothetical protein
MTARSSASGWTSTTAVPRSRSRRASQPSRRPTDLRNTPLTRPRPARANSCRPARQRVQAQHHVEVGARHAVEVGRRPRPAVDVPAVADPHRPVQPGYRARRRHRLRQLGRWRVVATEHHTPAGRAVGGDHPQSRVRRPALRDDALHRLAQRPGRHHPARGERRRSRAEPVAARVAQRPGAEGQRERAQVGHTLAPHEDAAGRAVGLVGPTAVRVEQPGEAVARGVGDHEPRRDAAGEQRADHRARGGADDDVGGRRISLRALGDGSQRAGEIADEAAQHPISRCTCCAPRSCSARTPSVARTCSRPLGAAGSQARRPAPARLPRRSRAGRSGACRRACVREAASAALGCGVGRGGEPPGHHGHHAGEERARLDTAVQRPRSAARHGPERSLRLADLPRSWSCPGGSSSTTEPSTALGVRAGAAVASPGGGVQLSAHRHS